MPAIPQELFGKITKSAHFKVAAALYSLADVKGVVSISTKELAEFCSVSESTLTRAFRDLEQLGFLQTTRTRKGFNRFSFNTYKLKLTGVAEQSRPSATKLLWQGISQSNSAEIIEISAVPLLTLGDGATPLDDSLSVCNERSTADQVVSMTSNSQVSYKGKEILRISIPSGQAPERLAPIRSEDKEPQSSGSQKLSIDPRNFRTRGRRPVESWTTWDVAAEFADRLQSKFPTTPLLINKKQLAEALRPMRSRYGSTALAEMWLLDFYFMDNQRVHLAATAPSKVIGAYLNLFKTHLAKALEASQAPKHEEVVFASDGRAFDNSMPGRKSRERYEEKLKTRSGLQAS